MINKFKKIINYTAFLLSVMFLIGFVSSIGVGSIYSRDSPLRMYSGETKTVLISLQNTDIETEITLGGKILNGEGIASLDKEFYKVDYKESDVFAKMKVEVPETAGIGQKYAIEYEFSEVDSEDGGGMVQFERIITRGFEVIVEEKLEIIDEEPLEINWIIWLLVLVLLIAILIIVYLLIRVMKTKKISAPVKSSFVKTK